MSKYLDSTGLGYFWGKIKSYIKWRNVCPEQSKTFTGVIATANNDPAGWLYFGWIKPDDYFVPYKIRYRIVSEMPGLPSSVTGFKTSYFDIEVRGVADTYYSYSVENVQNASYRSLYNHLFYSCTKTGIDAGYGPLLGFRLQSAYRPAIAAYARTMKIDIIETENCDFTFYDTPLVYASVPGTGSTNYKTRVYFDGTTNGHTQAGDRNDVNYYNRNYYGCRKTYTALYRFQICLSRSDRTLLPVNTANNVVAKTKTMTTESFDPFGEILYWASTQTYAAGENVGDGWYNQYLADIRYAFNCGGNDADSTLVARKPLYLVAVPNADGTAHLHSEPLAQDLPNSEDGLLYIYLGQVYPDTKPYRLYLSIRHPVYAYKNGGVRVYTQYADYAHNSDLVNGHTVESDVPANAVFTDTTYSPMTQAQATAGTSTDGMLISPKVLIDTIGSNVTVVVEDNKIKITSR